MSRGSGPRDNERDLKIRRGVRDLRRIGDRLTLGEMDRLRIGLKRRGTGDMERLRLYCGDGDRLMLGRRLRDLEREGVRDRDFDRDLEMERVFVLERDRE